MKGQSLYQVYQEELGKASGAKPRAPEWKHLLPSERAAWDATAAFLAELLVKVPR